MSFETSTSMIEYGMLSILVISGIIILVLKSHFRNLEKLNLTEKYKNWKWSSPAEARTKYPELDVFKISGSLRIYGVMVALIMMIFAFSWTNYDKKVDVSNLLGTLDEVIEMETPRTAEPPPPPPPPPQVVQILATDLPDIETRVFEDQSIDEQTAIEPPIIIRRETQAAPPPPPPPPPPEPKEQEIFKVVEDAPIFSGCEEVLDKAERQKCAETKLLEFIYSKISYPPMARENGVEGMVYIQFVVETDGSISKSNIIRDIGGGCGDEALRVVNMMPNWNPGKQRGVPVRVMFTLPVKFDLK
ncbi:MAG: TonB family protein [Bacteroidetes bacterium]|nr:TonB family protein [Bacteroidota bacterium]